MYMPVIRSGGDSKPRRPIGGGKISHLNENRYSTISASQKSGIDPENMA